jgi:hypothetical protein
MLAILHLLGAFVANLFKSPRRLDPSSTVRFAKQLSANRD